MATPKKSKYSSLKVEDLRSKAKKMGIQGISKLNKMELLKVIINAKKNPEKIKSRKPRTKKETGTFTIKELITMAKRKGISGYSGKRKSELLDFLGIHPKTLPKKSIKISKKKSPNRIKISKVVKSYTKNGVTKAEKNKISKHVKKDIKADIIEDFKIKIVDGVKETILPKGKIIFRGISNYRKGLPSFFGGRKTSWENYALQDDMDCWSYITKRDLKLFVLDLENIHNLILRKKINSATAKYIKNILFTKEGLYDPVGFFNSEDIKKGIYKTLKLGIAICAAGYDGWYLPPNTLKEVSGWYTHEEVLICKPEKDVVNIGAPDMRVHCSDLLL